MEYTGEGINALVCALEDLQNSKLIYIDQNVRTVLKCLAYYPEFRKVLEYCNKNFDYESEKRKALGKISDTYVLRLPKNQKTLVALVAQMLFEFDAGIMDIIAFSDKYFPQDTKQSSFNECFYKLIEPFKFSLVKFVTEGIEDSNQVVERQIDFAPDGIHQQAEYLLVNMAKAVQESQLDKETRDEFSLMLEGFAAALDSRDTLMIKSIWIGLSKALNGVGLCDNEIGKINEILKLYLVTK